MSKKLTLNVTDEQITRLYQSLGIGSPITIALQYAGISLNTYYYWVALYSVALYCREQKEMEKIQKAIGEGISIQQVQDMAAASTNTMHKTAMGNYIEPTAEAILRYKNSLKFRKYADMVYEIIARCNQIRSEVAMKHLQNITKSADPNKRIKASGSMWFLERTMQDYFGRAADKAVSEETTPASIPPVQVEFVDPSTPENKDRLRDMEDLVLEETKGVTDA